jgi:hypothetical protein
MGGDLAQARHWIADARNVLYAFARDAAGRPFPMADVRARLVAIRTAHRSEMALSEGWSALADFLARSGWAAIVSGPDPSSTCRSASSWIQGGATIRSATDGVLVAWSVRCSAACTLILSSSLSND